MSRTIIMSIAIGLLALSGCATVRSTYTACLSSPCLPGNESTSHSANYNPIPLFDNADDASAPITESEKVEDDVPPPPPERLDSTWFNAKPIRTPVIPPAKESTVRWSKKLIENFKS